MSDHLVTVVAYAGVAAAVTLWFWRTQGDGVRPLVHGVVAVLFGVLWPVALLYRAAVRAVLRVIAWYRLRRRPSEDRSNLQSEPQQ